MANSARIPVGANQDNTARNITHDFQTPAYAATLNITPLKAKTIIQPGTLTGALTVNVGVGTSTTPPYIGDELIFLFACDGSARTVTLGTGLVGSAATLALSAAKKGRIDFTFDGAAWIEAGRTVGI